MSRSAITRAPEVNVERVRAQLRAFARIGYSPDGSMNRLAFTRADLRARQLLMHRLSSLGLEPRVDAIGNVFGRLPGARDPALSPVLIGSHLDTVPGGGRFDGSAGVVAALEVATALRESGLVVQRPVEVVSFACEESSRFGRATLGSGLMAGAWDAAEVLELRDARGATLGQLLRRLRLDPERLATVPRKPGDYAAYLELHIEQGRVLEESDAHIGIVEAIAAPTRVQVVIEGRADHSGATPMRLRRDALAGAAEAVLAVERVARASPGVVATVGVIHVEPNVINVVPGRALLGIDIRSTDRQRRTTANADIHAQLLSIMEARELRISYKVSTDEEPVQLDATVAMLLEAAAISRGLRTLRMASGAGHDAMQLAKICPSGMVLVPSRAGISHNREEWTRVEDIAAGAQVLLEAVLRLATETSPS